MSNIHAGNEGSVTLTNGTNLEIASYTLNYGPNLLPTPVFGDEFAKAVKGLKVFDGSITAFVSSGAAGTNPFDDMDGTATFQWAPGCSISTTIVTGQKQASNSADGLPMVTFPFMKSGDTAPTVTWDEAA